MHDEVKDTRQVFSLIRRIAPRARFHRLKIRDENASTLAPSAEGTEIKGHFEKVWGQPPTVCGRKLEHDFAVCKTRESQIQTAVGKIRSQRQYSRRATAGHSLEIGVGACQEWIRQHFISVYNASERVGRGIFPASWYDTFVILLPKPGKAVGPMKSLRPIGLQDPVAKATISVIAKVFREYTRMSVCSMSRSTHICLRVGAAIARVIGHCRTARNLVRSQIMSIHQARAGIESAKFTGALQVSIGRAQAFARAPQSLLQEAVNRTAAPQKLSETI